MTTLSFRVVILRDVLVGDGGTARTEIGKTHDFYAKPPHPRKRTKWIKGGSQNAEYIVFKLTTLLPVAMPSLATDWTSFPLPSRVPFAEFFPRQSVHFSQPK